MQIGIDICRLTDPWTGIGNYIANLLAGLAAVDRDNQYILYPYFPECFPRRVKDMAQFVPPQDNFSLWGAGRPELLVKLLWFKLKLPQPWFLAKPAVTHSTNLAGPRLTHGKLVVTVHDLSFCRQPQWHKQANNEFSLRALTNAVAKADLLIAPSRFTALELEELYPATRGRVRVVSEAVLPVYRPATDPAPVREVLARHGLERPYLLFVGTLEPRKNLVRLLAAYERLVAGGQDEFDLVLAGGTGWKAGPIEEALSHSPVRERIRRLGYVPGPDLPALYQGAWALVYPSLYEGFGLPVLEALACGVPVVTSAAASLPEVGGDAALYLDPEDPEQLLDALERITGQPGLREDLAAKAPTQAGRFSQEAMGRTALAVYREAAEL
ncbi:MAG: glycosyltransferase family 4 protein [Desulfarculus sp.]|nr:glycosyltransferase family 4 protein [Pseudomonadota bacterium]MBV1716841.1 glycosyltransferase family 4 protein [Desulfarculus sp.]MBU4576187.1 glycosyltransferase family 4 protein [Pseudomonadota bacterium]MBU4598898.1 glycosyltransferase family 4 protein [Pseudomonadota bacterium]MBV1738344.1 glycosyltransferase family 4 protein [Desulfarculus sp.]